ncbi:DNA-3-methyladenine glycosylase [Thiomonas sp. FB-6]|uniref:DNA-3-methyladenine glycosylase family protein n=1 Tax=Thiomonas sp. FB-6 TaxID=1158291 RepID=UPI00036D8D7A|nr:AlkA N-terminal domain-containing protein [Thiomonas sp. FB-6]
MNTDPAAGPGARRFLLDLPLRPPYDWPAMLGFLALRAIPGVEAVHGEAYARSIRVDDARGWMLVRPAPRESALRAELHLVQGSPGPRLLARLRHLFDLDTDPGPMLAHLGRDALLEPLVAARPGLRVPGAWEGFELGVRAVLGQQVTLGAARTLAARLVALHGEALPAPPDAVFAGIDRLFPRAARVAEAQELGLALRMPRARAAALCGLARAAAQDPGLLGDGTGTQALEASLARLRALPGIGDWTAQYIAMRALRQPDAFPAGDVGLARAVAVDGRRPGAPELLARAAAWRPWRAYAALHLWTADAGAGPRK